VPAVPGPEKIRTVTIHTDHPNAPDATESAAGRRATSSQGDANKPLSILPSSDEGSATARPRTAPSQPIALKKPPANENASTTRVAPTVGYAVQVSSHQSEEEAQSSFRDLQTKYSKLLGGYTPIIRRADLGAKGIYYRTMVGPFASADQATELCSNLKAAGVRCLVQKY
jgi:cell division septation protein DedD